MKNWFKYITIMFAGAGLLTISCEDSNTVVDQVVDGTERGAVLRTANLVSNELPIGDASAGFSVELEVQDEENGALVSSVDVYVGFRDNTDLVGPGTDVEESLFGSVEASTFTTGPFGLPRFSYTATLSEMLAHVGRTEADITGGDQFTIRFELVLSDGRRYSFADNTGTLTGSFFSSPFLYTPTVTCPVSSDSFVGDYLIEQISAEVDGPTLSTGTIVTLSVGETSVARVFQTANYPNYCSDLRDFTIELICGEINIPNQNSGCACGDGGDWFTNPIVKETYDPEDDSVFLVTFTDDAQSNCSSPAQTTYRFTKQ